MLTFKIVLCVWFFFVYDISKKIRNYWSESKIADFSSLMSITLKCSTTKQLEDCFPFSFWFTLEQVMPLSQTSNVLCQGNAFLVRTLTYLLPKKKSSALKCAKTMSTALGSLSILKLIFVSCLLAAEVLMIHIAHSAQLVRKNVQFLNLSAGSKDFAWAMLHTQRKKSGIQVRLALS